MQSNEVIKVGAILLLTGNIGWLLQLFLWNEAYAKKGKWIYLSIFIVGVVLIELGSHFSVHLR